MIFDRLENAEVYANISDDFRQAFDLLGDKGIAEKEDGDHSTENPNVKYTVLTAGTRSFEDAQFESHKKYADIHYVLNGSEQMGVFGVEQLEPAGGYDSKKDLMFYRNPAKFNIIDVAAGDFCVFFPHEGHLPLCHAAEPTIVKKVIVKVRVND